MRLIFTISASPHHGFDTHYSFLDKIFKVDDVFQFETHGSLECMPNKQASMTDVCYPENFVTYMDLKRFLFHFFFCIIFRISKEFCGGDFSVVAIVMSDIIHKDPNHYFVLDDACLPNYFVDAIMVGFLPSADAVACIQ